MVMGTLCVISRYLHVVYYISSLSAHLVLCFDIVDIVYVYLNLLFLCLRGRYRDGIYLT